MKVAVRQRLITFVHYGLQRAICSVATDVASHHTQTSLVLSRLFY